LVEYLYQRGCRTVRRRLRTADSGDVADALRLLTELLLEMERALGPRHPDVFKVRNNIAVLTG